MRKKCFLITGRPGIGKTTALHRIAEMLSKRGYSVGGMVTFEVRERGRRVGFKIRDILEGREGWLAHIGFKSGPRVGKYIVNLNDLNEIGVQAILSAVERADVVCIDEIGPMELYSREFKNAVLRAFDSGKPVVATIHIRADRDPFARSIKRREDVELYVLSLENRNRVPVQIFEKILALLAKS